MKTKFILFTMFFSTTSMLGAITAICTCKNKDVNEKNIKYTSKIVHLEKNPAESQCKKLCRNNGGLKTVSYKQNQ